MGDLIDVEDLPVLSGPRCASASGLSLHANVAVPARDRKRLERLCRYVARPPLASSRLAQLADGRLLYRLKHPWRDGTTGVVFTPQELIEKLAALVPPPRFHLVRYHGVLGPAARERPRAVPVPVEPGTSPSTEPRHTHRRTTRAQSNRATAGATGPTSTDPSAETAHSEAQPGTSPSRAVPAARRSKRLAPGSSLTPARRRRLAWADLLRRVFAIDILECSRCHGRLQVVAAIHAPGATQAILACLELPSRAPPVAPPRSEDDAEAPLGEAWPQSKR